TRSLGLPPGGWYVGVVAISVDGPLQVAELAAVLRRDERQVLSEIRNGQYRSIVRFDNRTDPAELVEVLVGQLNSTALPSSLRVGITEPQREMADVATTMTVAATAATHSTESDYVGLARDFTLDHFLTQVDSAAVERFLDAALGPLRTANRSEELIATLAALFRTGSRVSAAESLRIHRQTMYQRLARIESILGRKLGTADRSTGALRVAVEIAAARGGSW
ncbi:MAG: helix-turn-helix domain-containing protein, partial [Mycolicibacterium sp.]